MRQSILVPATYGLTLAQTMFAAAALVWGMAAFTGYAPPVRALRVVLGGLLLGGTISALFGLLYAATGLDLAPNFRIPVITKASDFVLLKNFTRAGLNRPQGSAGHALELCAVLTVLIPLGVAMILSARKRGAKTWPWALCTAIIVAADLASLSRSAVVGGAAAVAVMCWRWPVRRLLVIVTSTVGLFIVGTAFQVKVVLALIATFAGSKDDSSLQSRAVGQAFVAENVWKRLWFGQGVGAYPTLKQPVLDNQYLSRLMESGVFGLVTFVAALLLALYLAIRASARATGVTAELASGISGAIAALIVICLILDTSGFMQIWYLNWILAALAGAAYRLSGEKPPG